MFCLHCEHVIITSRNIWPCHIQYSAEKKLHAGEEQLGTSSCCTQQESNNNTRLDSKVHACTADRHWFPSSREEDPAVIPAVIYCLSFLTCMRTDTRWGDLGWEGNWRRKDVVLMWTQGSTADTRLQPYCVALDSRAAPAVQRSAFSESVPFRVLLVV